MTKHEHEASYEIQGEGQTTEYCKCGYVRYYYCGICASKPVWKKGTHKDLVMLMQEVGNFDYNEVANRHFELGIVATYEDLGKSLNEKSAEKYKNREDDKAEFLRMLSDQFKERGKVLREEYNEKYKGKI